MQAGHSFHAQLFLLRSTGFDGQRILWVHGRGAESLGADYAVFLGVVRGFAVILTVQFFTSPVSGGSNGRLSFAALNLCYIQVKQGQ